MAEEILDGINPTRMELLALKDREKLAVKGHSLLKQKRDALIKEFFDILDRVKGARENAETNLSEAYAALTEAQITMGDLAVQKAALSVKESVKVDISSRSIMGVNVPIADMEMESRTLVDRGYGLSDTSIQLDEAAKKFETALRYIIEMKLEEMERENFVRMKMIRSTIEKNEAEALAKAQLKAAQQE